MTDQDPADEMPDMQQRSGWVAAGAAAGDPQYRTGDPLHGYPEQRWRSVVINLDLAFPRDPAVSPTRAVSGVDLTGVVRGRLDDWVLAGSGVWFGRCTFALSYVDGRHRRYQVQGHLVPDYALRLDEL